MPHDAYAGSPVLISPLNKGLGSLTREVSADAIGEMGWNLLREDLSLPVAVLYQEKLQHNLEWMRKFIAAYGLKLAPHGKTTMAPALFALQMQHGAWGMTLATPHQTMIAKHHGIRRVLMANQLIGRENMAIISRLLEDPDFEFFCIVDSAAQVDQLGAFYSSRTQRLRVLIELGVTGGRTGIRNEEQLESVLTALDRWKGAISLAGVELYEGVLDQESAIRDFLKRAVSVSKRLAAENRFSQTPFLLSGAGSAWYDVVADEFSLAGLGDSAEIVLRPGCYLTHDTGIYRAAQARILERNPIARQMQSGLKPALQVWAYVQSIPESQRAIIAMGKRDVAFDAGLPVPALHFRPGSPHPHAAPAHWKLTKMMDQHAYLELNPADDLRVGDMIGFDISHPCLTFDKWRVLPILDTEYRVTTVVQTFF